MEDTCGQVIECDPVCPPGSHAVYKLPELEISTQLMADMLAQTGSPIPGVETGPSILSVSSGNLTLQLGVVRGEDIKPKTNADTCDEEPWELKDLRKT